MSLEERYSEGWHTGRKLAEKHSADWTPSADTIAELRQDVSTACTPGQRAELLGMLRGYRWNLK